MVNSMVFALWMFMVDINDWFVVTATMDLFYDFPFSWE